jgi:hypothetical protein
MDDPEEEIRVGVVEYLVEMGAVNAGVSLAEFLPNETPVVQLAILSAIRHFKTAGVGEQVLGLINTDGPIEVKMAALLMAQSVSMPEAAHILIGLITQEPGDGAPVLALEAARALRGLQPRFLMAGVITGLQTHEGETRSFLAETFSRTTGQHLDVDWSTATPGEIDLTIELWRDWYDEHQHESRLEWLWRSLREDGLPLPERVGDETGVVLLVESLDSRSPRNFYIQELLSEVTGEDGPPRSWSVLRQQRHWRELTATVH